MKTTLIYHYPSIEMAKIERTDNIKGKDAEQLELLYHWWEYQLLQPLWKNI